MCILSEYKYVYTVYSSMLALTHSHINIFVVVKTECTRVATASFPGFPLAEDEEGLILSQGEAWELG